MVSQLTDWGARFLEQALRSLGLCRYLQAGQFFAMVMNGDEFLLYGPAHTHDQAVVTAITANLAKLPSGQILAVTIVKVEESGRVVAAGHHSVRLEIKQLEEGLAWNPT